MILRAIRWVLGQIILFGDWLTRPKPPQRTPEAQAALDAQTANLALYQFRLCPFCVKVRRAIHRLGLNIELRDALNDPQYRAELIEQGGQRKVPCLRIEENGETRWLYESSDQVSLRSRERFWDIPVPKIDSIFDSHYGPGRPASVALRYAPLVRSARQLPQMA